MTLQEIKLTVAPILIRHDVKRAGLFGSVVRNETTSQSDVDILVEFNKPMSLLEFIGVKLELEEQLGSRVDLVEYKAIKPSLKDYIMHEHIRIV
jgi:predicted nucleotidyltransferase